MEKIKVLYIMHSTMMAGATISFVNMVNGLVDKGIEPIIAYPDDSKDLEVIEFFENKGIKCYSIPVAESVYPCFSFGLKHIILFIPKQLYLILQKKKSFIQLEKIVKETTPDIIHSNVGVIHEGHTVAQKYKIPHCWHLREYQDKDFDWRIFPTKQYFISALKHSNVITITKKLMEHFHLQNSKTACVIYNGVLHENEKEYIKDKEKYFLCASRISPEKGIDEVLRSFAEFCKINGDYKLLIAGFCQDNNYMIELQELVNKLGVSDKIDFLGYLDNSEIVNLMSKASALIVASKNEAFGRMTAETLFKGCLVIGRNTGGTKEILEHTNGGWLYDNQDELTKYMFEAVSIANTEQYTDKIINAQKIAIDSYSIEQNVNKVHDLYNEILSK